ncbi:alpha-galactosidase [Ferruginibacter paludis]|uniref:glycoside hydrolase family 36 protein n=1 Tax=Ferruginibacter paludis TaxID=1310417 RepID=UPI0025B2FBCF|nr:glycoside hydrolase family 36 protein [Ferruginibacter paludis]MDN3655570.1 alpha-galactosidase [Ferruginibacter paludis]
MKYFFFIILVQLFCACLFTVTAQNNIVSAIKQSDSYVLLQDGSVATNVKITRTWQGTFCNTTITNTGVGNLNLKEAVLFQANHLFKPETAIYAEGFQMLSQYRGTLASPKLVGGYDDNGHYKLPQPAGYKAVYNMLVVQPANSEPMLMGFNSSFRYIGKFYLSADTVKVVMDMENTLLKPGASVRLEEFSILTAKNNNALTSAFASRINHFHPRLQSNIPAGWCSWYCFGPDVTAKNITDHLTYIKQNIPQLKYIQLDDGYQPHMGDWLETGNAFGNSIQAVLKEIKTAGFEPAIWVAPFICDSNSRVFKEHPDWLVKDSLGKPLRSDKVTFGGWRLAPWYALDATNPAVQAHLTHVFKTMSAQWGCTYFKLDANFWGALPGGLYYDKTATRVTAYRSGMKAILKGAGNAFILGCNHPLWPSIGLINGSRSSNDISRDWNTFSATGDENLLRSWQNGRLWWNDPDCVLLTGNLPSNEFMYHASLLFATGGLVLSGDDLTIITPERLAILKKMLPPKKTSALFNPALDVGWLKTPEATFLILLNKDDQVKKFTVPLSKAYQIKDYWTDEKKGVYESEWKDTLPAHSGKVYQLKFL